MRRVLIAFGLACIFGIGALAGSAVGETSRIAHGKTVYELWRTWDVPVPLSVVFKGHCATKAHADDTFRVEWARSTAVIRCSP